MVDSVAPPVESIRALSLYYGSLFPMGMGREVVSVPPLLVDKSMVQLLRYDESKNCPVEPLRQVLTLETVGAERSCFSRRKSADYVLVVTDRVRLGPYISNTCRGLRVPTSFARLAPLHRQDTARCDECPLKLDERHNIVAVVGLA